MPSCGLLLFSFKATYDTWLAATADRSLGSLFHCCAQRQCYRQAARTQARDSYFRRHRLLGYQDGFRQLHEPSLS